MSYAGKNLKYIRKQREWTQEEMANQLQIKRSLVGAYEEERAEPRLEVQEAICALLNISLEEFLFQDLSQRECRRRFSYWYVLFGPSPLHENG